MADFEDTLPEEVIPVIDDHVESHQKRAKSVKLAVLVSVFSKIFGFLIQFAAIPFAVASLGHGYQIYALIANLGNLIGIASIGAGPGIAMELTGFAVRKNEAEERKWVTSGLIVTTASTGVILFVALAIALFVPMPSIFGATVVGHEGEMRAGFILMAFLATLHNTLSYFANVYLGYLEDYKSKIAMMAGYALSIPLVFYVCTVAPSPLNLALAIFGMPVLSLSYLVYTLWVKDRPYLRFDIHDWVKERGVKIFNLNLLSTYNAVGSVMAKQGTVLMLSKFGPNEDTAGTASTLIQWYVLAVSVYVMIAGSCWPSFSNAKKHGDWNWIVKGLKRLTLALFGSGVLGGLIVGFFGVPVADFLFRGKEVFVTPELAWLCGAVVFLAAFEVGALFLLMAFDKMKRAAYVGLMQGVAVLCGVGVIKAMGIVGMMYVVIGSLLVLALASLYYLRISILEIKAEVLENSKDQ